MDDLLFRRIIGHTILHGDVNEILPLIVHRCYLGNYMLLIQAAGKLDLDMPVFLSKFCPEEVERFTFDPEAFGADQLFTQGAIGQEKVSACQWWLDLPKADWLEEPLQSLCPILILTGQYDANTPVRMGEQIHKVFPRQSRHLILPHEGHYGTVSNSCSNDIIFEFVKTRNLESLNVSCLDSLKPRKFFYEIPLQRNEFEKYVGEYTASDTTKQLRILIENGGLRLKDEYGQSELLNRGNHTFALLDCDICKLIFELDGNKVKQVQRIYRETNLFKPK